jgi:hypothetical protein
LEREQKNRKQKIEYKIMNKKSNVGWIQRTDDGWIKIMVFRQQRIYHDHDTLDDEKSDTNNYCCNQYVQTKTWKCTAQPKTKQREKERRKQRKKEREVSKNLMV